MHDLGVAVAELLAAAGGAVALADLEGLAYDAWPQDRATAGFVRHESGAIVSDPVREGVAAAISRGWIDLAEGELFLTTTGSQVAKALPRPPPHRQPGARERGDGSA